MSQKHDIREPAVAGRFYPSDADVLRRTVDTHLGAGNASAPSPGQIRAMLSPHAGYPFSGALAGGAIRALRGSNPDVIIVLSPSHVDAFDFASVFDGTAYRTPLGDVPTHVDIARAIGNAHPSIRRSPRGHVRSGGRGEHGIETQLPFLQRVAPHASIVPIVMGDQTLPACVTLAAVIRETAPYATILASSDLSHFYSHSTARRMDDRFLEALTRFDVETMHDDGSAGRSEACGIGPVSVAALAAYADAPCRFDLYGAHTSGDVTGEYDSVVGYASGWFIT